MENRIFKTTSNQDYVSKLLNNHKQKKMLEHTTKHLNTSDLQDQTDNLITIKEDYRQSLQEEEIRKFSEQRRR